MQTTLFKKSVAMMVLLPMVVLCLMAGVNFVVDPYNFNRVFDFGLDKSSIAYRANYRLYKIKAFESEPCANILLGDSRMEELGEARIEELSGMKYFNFAYGGGTLYEAIDTFWYAAHRTELKRVYFGINFNIYNESNRFNIVGEAEEMAEEPWKYYLSSFVTKISVYLLLDKYAGIRLVNEKPAIDKEAFWQKQLTKGTDDFYAQYEYPKHLYVRLKEIEEYCSAHNIHLTFIIPPTHVELQERVKAYDLTQEYQRYKEDLNRLGQVYDFDVDTAMNRNKDIYRDPYHGGDSVQAYVIRQVWGAHPKKNETD